MRILSFVIFLIATIPVSAQQWVLDEIAEEYNSSESIPTWLVGVLLIIGFLVYKHLQRKDEEEQERRIKEQKYEEEQQLEEELQQYREQHDDDIDFYEDDDNLIIPDISSAHIINKEPSATKSVSDESTIQSTPIETEFYTISADRKTFIKAKDTDTIIRKIDPKGCHMAALFCAMAVEAMCQILIGEAEKMRKKSHKVRKKRY